MQIELSGNSVFVEANGLRHHVLAYGDPHGRHMLLLPGITSPAATADFVAVKAASFGYRVYVPDIRGRGLTPPAGPGHYRLEDYAADVDGLVGALGMNAPVVIGHSMGARIAVRWAVTYASRRHGLLMAVDPPTSGPDRPPYPTTCEEFVAKLREAKRGITAEDIRLAYPGWPSREVQIRADMLWTCDETAIAETHHGFEHEDFFPDWSRLTRPAVLVRGGESRMVSDEAVQELRRANPDIDVVTVPHAGHMVMWDNLEVFWDLATDYLRADREGSHV